MISLCKQGGYLRSPVFLLVGIILAVIITGCAGGRSGTAREEPVGTGGVTALSTQAVGQDPAGSGEDVLRIAMQPIVQTDPALISTDSEVLVASHVYDYLLDIDAQTNLQPRLAVNWQVSEDGLSYTLQLREGVTFHDGSPFTAEDVVWTFDRLRSPGNEFATASLYANIRDIRATGEHEVVYTLATPNPFFLFDLSDNHALILKAGTTDPGDFNGTGPFTVSNYLPEDRVELAANPDYFIDGQPGLSGVEVIFFADDIAAVDALRGGQVDIAMRMSSPLFESLQGIEDIQTLSIPTNGFDLVRLRADREPGNDPRVIQALKLLTDREAIFQLVQQGYGAAGRDSPIGPLYPDYYSEAVPLPARDVEAARQLLAEAGYEQGLQLDLHTPDTGNRPDLAVVLKEQWAEGGVDLNVIVEPESVYYGENGWLEVDLGITGWGSRPYPQFYLDVMLACDAEWNEAHFCDEELDELIETAGTTLNENERVRAYAEIQRILIERGPVIIPYFFAQFAAINDRFANFELQAFAGRSDLRDVRLIK